MKLLLGGLSYKTADLELREEFSLTNRLKKDFLTKIKQDKRVKEGLILTTCNRTEIYILVADDQDEEIIYDIFKLISNRSKEELEEIIYNDNNLKVVEHLYKVASGLDSLVIGEDQILGQIKDSFELAQSFDIINTYFYKLFTEAIRVGKRVRTETAINEGGVSIAYVAVELAKQIFGCLAGETVLILGAGEMSQLVLKSLVDYGVEGVLVSNRTYERAESLADKFSGQAIRWDRLEEKIKEVDIVIASTAAPHLVLRYDLVAKTMESCRGPLFLIDIALPRDIEKKVKEIAGVHLYDLDDLEDVVDKNNQDRKKEITKVKEIITCEVKNFADWLKEKGITPVIKQMRMKANKIKREELLRAKENVEKGDDIDSTLEELANRLTNKLLHQPTVKLKELAMKEDVDQLKEIQKLMK